jgi:LPXTG-motif cell wall-anchored protein
VQADADGSVPTTTADGEQLPNTGLGLLGLLALGLPLLVSGLALRRRAA